MYQRRADGTWQVQQAGDRIALSQWSDRDACRCFCSIRRRPGVHRLVVHRKPPVPVSPEITLLTGGRWTASAGFTLALGAYLGFGLLVLFIGLVHARLYTDRAFVAYACYVANMLARCRSPSPGSGGFAAVTAVAGFQQRVAIAVHALADGQQHLVSARGCAPWPITTAVSIARCGSGRPSVGSTRRCTWRCRTARLVHGAWVSVRIGVAGPFAICVWSWRQEANVMPGLGGLSCCRW